MQDLPLVSVLMPVRNEAAFIQRSLGAVLAQDYPSALTEIIVADGMSSDRTRAIIESLQREHHNLELVNNPGRIVATGLNAALSVAKGDVIIRVDGHCEVASDYVSRCVSHLIANRAEGVGGPVETIGESYTARVIAAAMSSPFGVGGSGFRVGAKEPHLADTVPFPAYKRETIERAGDFDEELVRNQDDEYNYRVRKLGGRILLSPDVCSRYYSRSGMLSLWKQYFQYGFWKVRVLQKHPRQMQPRQFVPPLFVLALIMLGIAAPVLSSALLLLAALLLAYTILNSAAAIDAARKTRWLLLPLLPLAFTIIHLAYGSGFLFGLVRFWNRWAYSETLKVVQPSRDAASL
jgi:glycosyltransferase involved in cell wall biosynthesis